MTDSLPRTPRRPGECAFLRNPRSPGSSRDVCECGRCVGCTGRACWGWDPDLTDRGIARAIGKLESSGVPIPEQVDVLNWR